ncbi:alcohol dehydrogenase [Rhodococcus sp. ACPA4]|uniref:NADP-dependent oxidoreductase n=1 Tax=Rhodococcus TaxID=1827 RepID=UPI0005D46070|nr:MULTISPECIES: NADP-dependent oxidoreductase [Rhodococcus]KJF19845.1 Quinone oxidoreductase 1 [Rhodococcus sp. AD45]PBC41519.1 alcohol dehydrogenase [Rhodococcus sp. ACPA4]PSR40999.1 NADP-dependent oxidoreductase [Rhodococcus sp. AD45-ID]QXW03651.1 NADP-dependent oxidoreductase [Rhodococcus globerulus]
MTKTVIAQKYGSPDVLKLIDVEVPPPARGEVRVDVKAIGVNPFDYKLYSGAWGTDPSKLPIHLGGEAAGVVSAIGPDVTTVAVGDEVIVSPGSGLYSEQVVVPSSSVTPKPSSISWEQAAGLLLVGGTAVDALDTIRVGSGDTVLIHGASGGVGAIAVQLAAARGATVIGTAGASNQDYVRSLGATPVLYGDGLEARVRELAPNGVDAAFDTAGTDEAVDTSLALVADKGRIVTIVAFGRAQTDGFASVGGGNPASAEARLKARSELVEQAGSGHLTVKIAKTFPLADVALAHTELQSSHPAGKFILIP